jgi:hypothetical protein
MHRHAADSPRDRSTEGADDTSGMKADLLPPAASVLAETPVDFDREQVRGQRAGTAGPIAQAFGQHHRHGTGGGVHDTRGMGVVVIQAVDEDAIEQRSVASPVTPVGADDDVLARTGEGRDTGETAVREIERRRSEPDAERIEDAEFGGLDHVGRRGLELERHRMGCEPLRNGKTALTGGLQDCVHRTASNPERAAVSIASNVRTFEQQPRRVCGP